MPGGKTQADLIDGAGYEAANGFAGVEHVRKRRGKARGCLHCRKAHLANVRVKAEAKDGLSRAHRHCPACAALRFTSAVCQSSVTQHTSTARTALCQGCQDKRAHAEISMMFL